MAMLRLSCGMSGPAGRAIVVAAAAFIFSGCGSTLPSNQGGGGPPVAKPMASPTDKVGMGAPAVLKARAPARVISTEAWTFGREEGRVIRTDSYRLFTTENESILTSRMPTFMEQALDAYTSSLGGLPRPPVPLDTYLMANRPQWARLTQSLMGQQSDIYLKIQRGGFTAQGRAVLYDIGTHDTFSLVAHEGWHQYTQRTFRQPLPTWLEEGIAAYMEGFRWDPDFPEYPNFRGWANIERFDQLRKAAQENRLVGLDVLLSQAPQELLSQGGDGALTFYAQAWAAVHFLREGEGGKYREGLERLLRDAADGTVADRLTAELGVAAGRSYLMRRRGPELFRVYFNKDMSAASKEFEQFCRRAVSVGAKEKIVAGRSPVTNGE
ncbi:MAG: hypothetical protein IT436_15325 [Phycisphaerales bacterium]|nr:hypothetical protein [Phycisphaerales bacterium]